MAKSTKLPVEEFFSRLREQYKLKDTYQGINIEQVEAVLRKIGKYSTDIRDAVWCLLNDEIPSLFSKNGEFTLSDGASIAQIGSYVGVFMRNGNKLDREGRDFWIKPLREIGAIDSYTYDKDHGFLSGHIKAKSPNSCYRLNPSFVNLLQSYNSESFDALFKEWVSADSIRNRLEIQEAAEKAAKEQMEGNPHALLIQQSIQIYAKYFLPGFLLIYKDDSDGDRISSEEQALMTKFGIILELEDAFPDVILFNEELNSLAFIEAVTSDGEVDEHKIKGLIHICGKSGKNFGGATTTYLSWKDFYTRQHKHKNLGNQSKVWIAEDPQKEFVVQYYSQPK